MHCALPVLFFALALSVPAVTVERDGTGVTMRNAGETVRISVCGPSLIHVVAGPGDPRGASPEQPWFVPVENLSLQVKGDYRNGGTGFTPTVQAKYQVLSQGRSGVNASIGARYKQTGFKAKGGEAEAFVSVGRTFRKWLATGNAVAGIGVNQGDKDVEGRLGLGYQPTEKSLLGINGHIKAEVGDSNESGPNLGRDFELM